MPTQKQYSTQIVILGAGRAVRGDVPSAMQTASGSERILDWILDAFSSLPKPRVSFVAGFRAELLRGTYPELDFVVNPGWQQGNSGESLSYAQLDQGLPVWVSYADIVYRADIVEMVDSSKGDVVLAVDHSWKTRYARRARAEMEEAEKAWCSEDGTLRKIGTEIPVDEADAEFCGLLKLSPRAVLEVSKIFRERRLSADATLVDIIKELLELGIDARCVDVNGRWAELTAPQDLAQFVLGTKAESLARLRPLLNQGKKAVIGELCTFTYAEWQTQPNDLVQQIRETFPSTELIVRSSAQDEDSWDNSAAGAFDSVAGVDSNDDNAIVEAVNQVFSSYGQARQDNHVLVQELLKDVSASGVVMTRVPATSAPYYVINFDTTSRRTDTVTSGSGSDMRTVYLQRGAKLRSALEPVLLPVIEAVNELEQLVGYDSLDIEFAITEETGVHILQVRPIAASHKAVPIAEESIADGIKTAQDFLEQFRSLPPFQVGNSAPLSVMSDWNPAEIVGTLPKRLALSLYEHLITDEAWASQRARNGYRDIRPRSLLVDILGRPYVDVRASFNSFIPASLPEKLAEKLVNQCLDHLVEHPELHDKVEFDILTTCLDFDFDARAKLLGERGWTPQELAQLKDGLREVTKKTISSTKEDLNALSRLTKRYDEITRANLPPLAKARALLEDARTLGTPLFANLARSGFVAVSFLRSLQATGLTTAQQTDAFQRSVPTVSSELQHDATRVKSGSLPWDEFVHKYGHLRPGTYDICSPCYADYSEQYLRPLIDKAANKLPQEEKAAVWSDADKERISNALQEMALDIDVEQLEQFIRDGIEGREYAKFLFTRNLSTALEAIAEFGDEYGLTREQLSMVRIEDFFRLRGAPTAGWLEELKAVSEAGEKAHKLKQAFALPQFISSPRDLECFEQFRVQANYITRKKAVGEVVCLDSTGVRKDVAGRIVLLPNADPGFDWLFGSDIAGLITWYGGVNSHMAIRAAEFGLPAAIGVGGTVYERIAAHAVVELDCEIGQIRCS